MCHRHITRDRVRQPDEAATTDESDDEPPEFLNDEAETAGELVTDGGDGS